VKRLLDEGRVRLGDAAGRPSSRLKGGEAVEVSIPPVAPLDLVPEEHPLSVLFSDEHLVVIEKPAGMVVHPAPGHDGGTLVHALLALPGTLSGIGGTARPGIVHRLDRETSGVLVAARTDAAHRGLCTLFASHDLSRKYHAVVVGAPPRAEGELVTRIGRHPVDRKRMAVLREGGREAVTRWRLLSRHGALSLVEATLGTGRTHQVRVHMAHLKCPVAGDEVYGKGRRVRLGGKGRELLLDRFLLHAFHLAFVHPVTGEPLSFTVPDPPLFAEVLRAADEEG
jgi:23S rRNA pseudouridine1911/1915/1917 synthase